MPSVPSRSSWPAVLAVVAGLAVLAACSTAPAPTPAPTDPPAPPAPTEVPVTAAPARPLPTWDAADLAAVDPDVVAALAVDGSVTVDGSVVPGGTFPTVAAPDPAGTVVTFPAPGRPALIGLVAHWCPHCQAELADLAQANVPTGTDDLDVILVLVANDPGLQPWPPTDLVADADLDGVTVVVDDGTIAHAVELAATPSWLAVDGDGNLSRRVDQPFGVDAYEAFHTTLSGR